MPKLTQAIPKYRRHKASGQAIVSIEGEDFYLGPHGTKASHLEYDRVITEWLAAGRRLPRAGQEITIAELAIRYWEFAQGYYRKDGKPTTSLSEIKAALRPLKRLYGRTHASEFGPIAFKAIRETIAAEGTVNKRIAEIRRMFKWAVGEELVPPSVFQALDAVPGLRKGRCESPDNGPVSAVDDAVVQATLRVGQLPPRHHSGRQQGQRSTPEGSGRSGHPQERSCSLGGLGPQPPSPRRRH